MSGPFIAAGGRIPIAIVMDRPTQRGREKLRPRSDLSSFAGMGGPELREGGPGIGALPRVAEATSLAPIDEGPVAFGRGWRNVLSIRSASGHLGEAFSRSPLGLR